MLNSTPDPVSRPPRGLGQQETAACDVGGLHSSVSLSLSGNISLSPSLFLASPQLSFLSWLRFRSLPLSNCTITSCLQTKPSIVVAKPNKGPNHGRDAVDSLANLGTIGLINGLSNPSIRLSSLPLTIIKQKENSDGDDEENEGAIKVVSQDMMQVIKFLNFLKSSMRTTLSRDRKYLIQ